MPKKTQRSIIAMMIAETTTTKEEADRTSEAALDDTTITIIRIGIRITIIARPIATTITTINEEARLAKEDISREVDTTTIR